MICTFDLLAFGDRVIMSLYYGTDNLFELFEFFFELFEEAGTLGSVSLKLTLLGDTLLSLILFFIDLLLFVLLLLLRLSVFDLL